MDPSFIIGVFFPIVVILVMFGLGMSLTPDDFKRVLIYPKAVTIGLINQLVLLPLVAFLLVIIFPLDPELAVGVIIIATAPGGILSNVITHLAEADTALSVTLTALSSLLAFITIPLWLSFATFWLMDISRPLNVPILQLAVQVAALTLIPIGSGLFVRLKWPGFANSLRITIRFGSILLVTVAIIAFLIEQRQDLTNYLGQVGLVTAALFLSTSILGYASARLCRLTQARQFTIAIETGVQNVPLSLTIAVDILANRRIAVPLVAYGLIMVIIMALILVGIIMRWPIFVFSTTVDLVVEE